MSRRRVLTLFSNRSERAFKRVELRLGSGEYVKRGVSMYAVIESGGKQYRVSEGDVIRVERLTSDEGAVIEFDKVLLVAGEGSDSVKVGHPHVEGATVSGKVLRQGKGRKVLAFRYKPKKNVRVRKGHRQPFTEVEITDIKV